MFLLITTRQLLSELNKERRAVDDTALGLDWEAFRASEPSKSAVQGLKPEHLVSPAGSLGSELCFVLHYPTFQTKHPNNGEVFDASNRTITRLAGSGFNADNTLWLDTFCRRRSTMIKSGERFQPRKHAEPALFNHHLEWLELCLQTATAKVVVFFGKQNETLFREKWGNRLGEIKLWGDYDEISLWMLYPEEDETYSRVERLVLFVWHPEYLGRSEDIAKGRAYDRQLGLVARLAGLARTDEQIRFQETSSTTPGSIERAIAAAEASEEDKYAIIKRGNTKRKRGLTSDAVPLEVACITCGYPRLDVTPYYYVPDEMTSLAGRVYLAAYTQCPGCNGQSNQEGLQIAREFIPVDGNIRWFSRDSVQWGRSLHRLLHARDFTEGRGIQPAVGETRGEGVLLAGECAPKMISGSEVYVRPTSADNTV